MCIIKIRRADPPGEESPVVVPIRPMSRAQTTADGTTPLSASPRVSRSQQQQPAPDGANLGHRRNGSQQQIIIAQPSPDTARPKLPIHHGSSFSYGSGPVPTWESLDRLRMSSGQQQQHRRSYSGQQPGRRSTGSVTFGTNVSPRASHVSHRSTREKIVVVDETGRRRESGFH
ncbi:MAG: hypothetical protein LQ341_002368 [Variospora aurantia]|nr:MAG: hypothetical protein LQ341_002368 [Variospora aurantia]